MTCPYCRGTGWSPRRLWSDRLRDWLDVRVACPRCDGTGQT